MSFLEKFQKRYSVKKYIKNKQKINQEILNQLQEILRLSPSSINSQPWRFVFVTNEKIKQKLANCSFFNKESIENCDCLIVFCSIDDVISFEKDLRARAPQRAMDYYDSLNKQNGQDFIKMWAQKQVYIALGVLLSACACMEIDSTPMEGIDVEEYNKILDIKGYSALVAVTIGTRDMQDYNSLELKPKLRCDKIKTIIEI